MDPPKIMRSSRAWRAEPRVDAVAEERGRDEAERDLIHAERRGHPEAEMVL